MAMPGSPQAACPRADSPPTARRRRVRERHALWWIFAGVLALVVAVFPGILTGTATALGITAPTNLGFFLSTIILFLVSVQSSAELTVLEEKTRTLAENVALHDERLARLEASTQAPIRDVDA